MKTAHYTFTAWNGNAMASGFDCAGAALVREPEHKARSSGGDNIIDLNAWRAANLAAAGEAPDQPNREPEDLALVIPAPRPRKSRRSAFLAELASTIGVAAAALAVILWVAAF